MMLGCDFPRVVEDLVWEDAEVLWHPPRRSSEESRWGARFLFGADGVAARHRFPDELRQEEKQP